MSPDDRLNRVPEYREQGRWGNVWRALRTLLTIALPAWAVLTAGIAQLDPMFAPQDLSAPDELNVEILDDGTMVVMEYTDLGRFLIAGQKAAIWIAVMLLFVVTLVLVVRAVAARRATAALDAADRLATESTSGWSPDGWKVSLTEFPAEAARQEALPIPSSPADSAPEPASETPPVRDVPPPVRPVAAATDAVEQPSEPGGPADSDDDIDQLFR